MDFRTLYFNLFNAITDAIDELDCGFPLVARERLVEAQRNTEEMYIEYGLDEPNAGLTPEERYELVFHEPFEPVSSKKKQ